MSGKRKPVFRKKLDKMTDEEYSLRKLKDSIKRTTDGKKEAEEQDEPLQFDFGLDEEIFPPYDQDDHGD